MAQPSRSKRVPTSIAEGLHFRFNALKVRRRVRSMTLTDSLDEAFSEWLTKQEADRKAKKDAKPAA